MGQEIQKSTFSEQDENQFKNKLKEETKILMNWFKNDEFENPLRPTCGLELEAWLTDENAMPSPSSEEFLKKLNDPEVVPEISQFNFELNCDPHFLEKGMLNFFEEKLSQRWNKCEKAAQKLGLNTLMIGSIPTIRDNMLTLEYISPQQRYYALNSRILELKHNHKVELNIENKEHLHIERDCVLSEAAATSFQIHLQVSQEQSVRYYNASIIASAFMVALSANSPYFYGKELWDESRIPIFEQSVGLFGFRNNQGQLVKRVGMGSGYLRESMMELFLENLDGFPILLPMVSDEDPAWLNHLRLQNGTIWRWNRPIIGLSKNGRPHLRIEHRTPSAGPTIKDMVANLAFYVCLTQMLAESEIAPEKQISFEQAEKNFYAAAKNGFDADIVWLDQKSYNIQSLILNNILPQIEAEFKDKFLSSSEYNLYFEDILRNRVKTGQNGAHWQKAYINTHGKDFQTMTKAYLKNQQSGLPVHLWSV